MSFHPLTAGAITAPTKAAVSSRRRRRLRRWRTLGREPAQGKTEVAWAQWQWSQKNLHAGLGWMLGGIAFVALGCVLRRLPTLPAAALARSRQRLWLEAAFLVALTAAAGAVRLAALDHLPPGGFF